MSEKPNLTRVKASLARELAMRKAVYAKPGCRLTPDQKAEELACMEEALRICEAVGGISRKLRADPVVRLIAETLASGREQPELATRYRLGVMETTADQVVELMIADILAALK